MELTKLEDKLYDLSQKSDTISNKIASIRMILEERYENTTFKKDDIKHIESCLIEKLNTKFDEIIEELNYINLDEY